MSQEKTVKLNIDAKEALKRLDAVEKELKGIGKAAKNTEQGTKTLATGFKGIGLAWKAIGIGAVISGLQFLAEKFSANQEIMDKVNIASAVFGDVMNKIGTVVMSVVKSLGLLGKAVGKVLKGEFKEAGDLAKESFNGVKDAIVGNNESFADFIKNAKEGAKETVAYAKALTNLSKEVQLAEANQRLLQMQYQKEAEVQRQVRDDISLTFEERIAANEKLGQILDEQFAEEKALAQKKIDLAALELSRNKENVDLQVALINAKTEMADLDERITGQRSEQLTNLKALQKEKADAEQAELDLFIKKEAARNKDLADQKIAADKAIAIAKEEAKKKAEIERALAETRRGIVANSLGQVATLMGKESKAGKALAVGQALINTYSAAAAALAPPPVGAGPIFGPIAAIGAVAAGMANVKQILATKMPGAEGGGGGGGPEPAVPEEVVGGIGGMIPSLENIEPAGSDSPQPVQAFVVETDISNSQALQSELDLQATL
tara:strand:+ start:293 stop:1768 length:1476 start_codon:yes stop_codon:yes gene_type:complete